METKDKETIERIVRFWFEETTPEQKFTKDPEFDARITEQFLDVYNDVVAGKTTTWRETPEGRLAEIIVLDQFSRNMFRDQAKAFAADPLTLELAREARAVGADKHVPLERRTFFYLPYMHSESQAVHEEALEIFTELGNAQNLDYEHKHKAIIDQFGRYPYRNEVLGRESTPEEIAWLKENDGF